MLRGGVSLIAVEPLAGFFGDAVSVAIFQGFLEFVNSDQFETRTSLVYFRPPVALLN